MVLAGQLGRLFAAQGVVGVLLAVLAHGGDRPAAAWTERNAQWQAQERDDRTGR